MRDWRLYEDEKEHLQKIYKTGERYEVASLTHSNECDYLKTGLKGRLIKIDDEGYFIFDWDDNFDSHGEFPNWLQRDKINIC
jgi:hypothetical protein